MTRGRRGRRPLLTAITLTLTLTGALATSACGAIADTRDRAPGATAASTAQVAGSVDPDASLEELLDTMLERWRGLDQRVIDGDATSSLAGIEEVWAVAEPIIRAEHQGALFGFQQAVDLARSAVTRMRPADASKGYRLALDLTADLLER